MIINKIGDFFEKYLKKGINEKNNNQKDNKINDLKKFNSKEIGKKNSLKDDNEINEPFNNIEHMRKKEESDKIQFSVLETTLKSMKHIKDKNIDLNSTSDEI